MAKLFEWAEKHGGVCASSDTGFSLPDKAVRSPDASWVSQAKVDRLPMSQRRGFAPVCPEFLIKILSETDRRSVLEAKMEMWLANGAQLAWMIDPFTPTLSIYRLGQPVEILTNPEWVQADAVVPGFRLEMSRLWAK